MESLRFEGSGWEYFKIWIVNILLVIVTLGLYYPWAKVRNHRYFYANSTLDGRNFEYHATGKQLFLGYFIALVLFIIFATVQNIWPIMSAVLILVGFVALPWVIWRSFKFNLRVTSFSNVRFSFSGGLGGSYFNYLLLPILFFIILYTPIVFAAFQSQKLFGVNSLVLVIAALGIALMLLVMKAFMAKKNTEYSLNNYQYGQGQFATKVKTKAFVLITLKTIGLAIFTLAVFIGGAWVLIPADLIASFSSLVQTEISQDVPAQPLASLASVSLIQLLILVSYLTLIMLSFACIAFYSARTRRYIYAETTLDEAITFNSSLSARHLFWVMMTNFLWVIATLGLAIPWAKVRMARAMLNQTQVDAQGQLEQYITQQQDKQSALGDQIGDAFDMNVDLAF